MADNDSPRQDLPTQAPSRPPLSGARKERSRSHVSESPSDRKVSSSRKPHRRSATVVDVVKGTPVTDSSLDTNTPKEEASRPTSSTNTPAAEGSTREREAVKAPGKEPSAQSDSSMAESRSKPIHSSRMSVASESESSSGSTSGSSATVTHTLPMRRNSSATKAIEKPTKKYSVNRPNALSFLVSDSADVADGQATSKYSPDSATSTSPSARSASSASSGFRDDRSDFGDHETDRSTSPECSIDGDPEHRLHAEAPEGRKRVTAKNSRKRSYGTPEMPRGNVHLPHIPSEALTPRAPPNQQYPMHLPRAEKLPLTGYELLASRISAKPSDHRYGPALRPMYRRFETLNHRILLHLQDEISELEEQLHRLDTADTQNRCLQAGILPASRRAESMAGGELQWHKTDILGKIGFKLEQYNRVLASFRDTQAFPAPAMADVHEYRNYLASCQPIVDIESRFLDSADDLVCVGYDSNSDDGDLMTDSDDLATPMPRSNGGCPSFRSQRRSSFFSQSGLSRRPTEERSDAVPKDRNVSSEEKAKPVLAHLALAAAVAIILPILTFMVIPGFVGRMTVASLVGAGTVGALVQGKVVREIQATQELCMCVGLYGAVMSVLAGLIS